MRGKVQKQSWYARNVGITPAYAGKSSSSQEPTSDFRDHPRLCGEKAELLIPEVALDGSPPPMRGKVFRFFCVLQFIGITPAYAGKRQVCPYTCESKWDHPRLCGEKNTPLEINFK